MYIIKNGKGYTLSERSAGDAYCKVLPPAIVVDGAVKHGTVTVSDVCVQTCSIEGLTIRDEIKNSGNGIFKVTRFIKNENPFCMRFKSVFEADTIFKPNHFVFPGFHYDTSHCGREVEMGEIVCGWTAQMETLSSNTPEGLEKDGKPLQQNSRMDVDKSIVRITFLCYYINISNATERTCSFTCRKCTSKVHQKFKAYQPENSNLKNNFIKSMVYYSHKKNFFAIFCV